MFIISLQRYTDFHTPTNPESLTDVIRKNGLAQRHNRAETIIKTDEQKDRRQTDRRADVGAAVSELPRRSDGRRVCLPNEKLGD